MKPLLFFCALLVLSVAQNDLDIFSPKPGYMLWAETVFKLPHASIGQCASRCVSMRGRCLSFEYNRRHSSCFGRRHGEEVLNKQNRPHIRKNRHYDFYVSNTEKLSRTLRRREHAPQRPSASSTRAPSTQASIVVLPATRFIPPASRRTTPTTTTTTTTTTTPSTRTRRPAQPCFEPVGIADGRIPNSAFRAWSYYKSYKPQGARLNGDIAWMANANNQNQFLDIDLGREVQLTAIGTQGFYYFFRQNYVTKYKIFYQNQRGSLTTYQEVPGEDKIFDGNTDASIEKRNKFTNQPFRARHIRIVPTEWYVNIAMRVELYANC
ncbi:unnamed protein product [Clavelina lepadiformis]|uniref:F5/8 type C domain-containing protein n=1 Tax=Clavelina lepadiformis TaxID=159417 RepID=A0ABP0FRE9_CLALP